MDDLISIIMPVKNGLPYLNECLDSIIDQTYQNWELIVVNDHSTDSTWSVLQEYANSDSRIKPHNNIGKGIIDALTLGYDHSKGSFITRMDADDIMPSSKLLSLKQALLNTKQSVATGLVKYISETEVKDGYKRYEEWLNNLCQNNNHFSEIYKECVIPSPCWMMRKEDFDKIGGFSASGYPEDYDLCFRMYAQNIEVIPILKTLHYWRDHDDRASRNDDNYSDNRFLDIKLKYFQKIEFHKQNKLKLIGAGKKGKSIAKHLISNNIELEWYTNNPKKIGVNIHGKFLKNYNSQDLIDDCSNYIIAIANPEEQLELKDRLKDIKIKNKHYFC